MEARVQRLLRDARATVNRPTRPETPRELLTRQGSRRLSSVLLPSRSENVDNSGSSPSSSTTQSTGMMSPMGSSPVCGGNYGGSVASFASALTAAAASGVRDDLMRTLSELGTELRVIRPSDESAAVDLLATVTQCSERAMAAGDAELSVRAASTACRVAIAGGSPAYTPPLASAVAVLASQAARGYCATLKQELVLDTLVQLLRMPMMTTLAPPPPASSQLRPPGAESATRDLLILNAVAALRYCSSEGGPLLVHAATMGLLPAATQLAERVLQSSTRDLAILQHCAVIFRNFSVEYSHHFAKLKCLNTVLSLVYVAVVEGWKDVVTALSRALGKLVFDSDCVVALQEWELPRPLLNRKDDDRLTSSRVRRTAASVVLAALARFATSKMIVARLSTVLERLLDQPEPRSNCHPSQSSLEEFCQHHQTELQQCAEGVSALIRKERKSATASAEQVAAMDAASSAALFEEATTSVWRLFSTVSLCPSGGRLLCTCATRALILWLQDRELQSASGREETAAATQGNEEETRRKAVTYEDGTIHALMCLTNLSYYFPTTLVDEKTLFDVVQQLGPVVAGALFSGSTELTVEGTRLLGNLSGTESGRRWMEENRIDEVCLVLLGHTDFRIVYNCFGVVLNLTAADSCNIVSQPELCAQLLQHTARYHLLNVSEDDSDEAQVSTLVEKILLNLSALV